MLSEGVSSLLFIYLWLNIENRFLRRPHLKSRSALMLPWKIMQMVATWFSSPTFTVVVSSFQRLYHIWWGSFHSLYRMHLTMRGICAMQWRFHAIGCLADATCLPGPPGMQISVQVYGTYREPLVIGPIASFRCRSRQQVACKDQRSQQLDSKWKFKLK